MARAQWQIIEPSLLDVHKPTKHRLVVDGEVAAQLDDLKLGDIVWRQSKRKTRKFISVNAAKRAIEKVFLVSDADFTPVYEPGPLLQRITPAAGGFMSEQDSVVTGDLVSGCKDSASDFDTDKYHPQDLSIERMDRDRMGL